MAQQLVNIGASANDGTGDQLRTAFDKINDNFVEVYDELGGTSLSNIDIGVLTSTTISTATGAGNLIIVADGTDDVLINSDTTITGSGTITDTLTLSKATGTGLSVTADGTIGGTLAVTGITTLTDLVNADGGIAVDTSAFTVANTSGNTAIAGTLTSTGTAAFGTSGGISLAPGATPSVAAGNLFVGDASSTTITDFTGGTPGQQIHILVPVLAGAITYGSATLVTGAAPIVTSAAGFTMTSWMTLDGVTWYLTNLLDTGTTIVVPTGH
jgi:hypothetical protein